MEGLQSQTDRRRCLEGLQRQEERRISRTRLSSAWRTQNYKIKNDSEQPK